MEQGHAINGQEEKEEEQEKEVRWLILHTEKTLFWIHADVSALNARVGMKKKQKKEVELPKRYSKNKK